MQFSTKYQTYGNQAMAVHPHKYIMSNSRFPGQERNSSGLPASYSSDTTPYDFCMFPKLKIPLSAILTDILTGYNEKATIAQLVIMPNENYKNYFCNGRPTGLSVHGITK